MKIAVYTIAKNEVNNVDPWLTSCEHADYICVADTGSSDDTAKLFAKYFRRKEFKSKATLNAISINPWRFEDAHNAALALVPADADVCIPLHLDERLMPGWKEIINTHWKVGEHTKAFYTYVFAHNTNGSPSLSFLQNRIHARNGYRWRYPDHEGVYPYGDILERTVMLPMLRIEQWQDTTKDRSAILGRLKMGIAEYPDHSRMIFYYGRELMYARRFPEAVTMLEKYLSMDKDRPFPGERKLAAECLAQCWAALS